MIVVIDTSSLLSLVRYYLPFDKNLVLFNLIRTKLEHGEIVIIDKVLEECNYIAKGTVLSSLTYLTNQSFLKSYKVPRKTDALLAPSPAKFLRQLENQFLNVSVKKLKNLTDVEFEAEKEAFLKNADMRQIILCLNLLNDKTEVVLVTEETDSGNDQKLFKKIPTICKDLNIQTMTLPQLLIDKYGIDLSFK